MTAYTSPDNLPYPDDYQQPADSPSAFAALANAVQAALSATKTFASGLVLNTLNGTNTDKAPSQAAVKAWKDSIEARTIGAGNGLTGGGSLAASRTLNVVAGTGITVTADTVALNTGYTEGLYTRMAAEGQTVIGDKAMSCLVWNVGNLAAGEEKTTTVQVAKGSYVFVSVQHHSAYIFAVANLVTGATTDSCELKVRNSTTQTTHTNVKVHLLVVNP